MDAIVSRITSEARIDHVQGEQVALLYQSLRFALLATLLIVVFIHYLFRGTVPSANLAVWCIANVALTIFRGGLFVAYRSDENSRDNSRLWLRWFVVTLVIHALALSSANWVIFPEHDQISQLYLILIVVGIASGGAISLASHLPSSVAFVTIILSPLAIRFVYDDYLPSLFLPILVVYAVLLISTSRDLTRFIGKTLRLQQEKESIIENLESVERDLNASQTRLSSLFAMAPEAIVTFDADGTIQMFNHAASEVFGYDGDEVIGRSINTLRPPMDETHHAQTGEWLSLPDEEGGDQNVANKLGETIFLRQDQTEFCADASCSRSTVGRSSIFTLMLRDLTERKFMEDQLVQSQKMEAVGQLTGGIAHDFNNLLQIIQGNLSLLTFSIEDQEEAMRHVEDAMTATVRGSELTHQLLAFSRKQLQHPKSVSPNEQIEGMLRLLDRVLGEDVELETRFESEIAPIFVDPGNLQNAVLNLVVNAKSAMPSGGKLIVGTTKKYLKEDRILKEGELPKGEYVEISVRDTGRGMSSLELERVFEPFFTTKDVGEGSGLGLSMVYGFVRQSGGEVTLESEVDQGTTVRMLFPLAGKEAEQDEAPQTTRKLAHVGGLILLVEDDEDIRLLASKVLRMQGYSVLDAADGPKALQIIRNRHDINLLFSDVVLPSGMSGLDLAREARLHNQNIKVLLASGYPVEQLEKSGFDAGDFRLLPKPYSFPVLYEAVQSVLQE